MPQYIDAQGREHELLIADRDVVVKDPFLGFDRQIVAGGIVPPELQDGYEKQVGGRKAAKSQEGHAKPPRSPKPTAAAASKPSSSSSGDDSD